MKHILVISYEFTYSPFSGNGILARSLVQSLLDQDKHVTVWCCCPAGSSSDFHHADRLQVIPTEVNSWNRLDKESAWNRFCYQHNNDNTWLETKCWDVICAIDWHGAHAWRSLPSTRTAAVPLVYLNFRVYSSGSSTDEDATWYDSMEHLAVKYASRVICLSTKDAQSLQQMYDGPIDILYPPLRGDLLHIANQTSLLKCPLQSNTNGFQQRRYFTCVVRQSPEKAVQRFITILQQLKQCAPNLWKDLIPVLGGTVADPLYARPIQQALRDIAPHAIIIDTFLSPIDLAGIFQHTLVNFHPCTYDAYGMTIVEAAAMGAVSIVASNDNVGATAILGKDGYIPLEMMNDKDIGSLDGVLAMVQDHGKLKTLSELARTRALAWNEDAYGTKLLEILKESVDRHSDLGARRH